MNTLSRVTGLAPYLSATTHLGPSVTVPIVTEFALKKEKIVSQARPLALSQYKLEKRYSKHHGFLQPRATTGLNCKLIPNHNAIVVVNL